MEHSTLSDPLERGQHDGYRPGEFDPTTGIHNPTKRGYVRNWRHPDSVAGPNGLLARLEAFTGHSIRAVWTARFSSPYEQDKLSYVVLSYATPIAMFTPPTGEDEGKDLYEDYWIDYDWYGQVTRKHQGLVLSWMGRAIEDLKDISPRKL